MRNKIKFYLCGVLVMLLTSASALAGELVTLDTRLGVTQSFLLLEPKGEAEGVILMFPGHEGVVKFRKNLDDFWAEAERGGFTASAVTIKTYLKNGMVVALVAPPSDMQDGMDTRFRSSNEHMIDIKAVIAYLNKRYHKAPYLHGHCRSSFSPVSITTKLHNQGISGLILSSPRSSGHHGAVTDYTKDVITLPVLLIQHRDDLCEGTLYRNLDKVRRFFEPSAKKVDVMVVSGGDTRQTGPGSCQNGAHSFRGLEEKTASAIVNWMKGNESHSSVKDY